jgi:outer membrane protein OmpA-like peptidoglycan-associated protein
MKITLLIVAFFSFSSLFAQELPIQKVYFELDKHVLLQSEQKKIIAFTQKTDTAAIQSVQIYGYCDDRGTNDYNFKLSDRRVEYVQKILLKYGIKSEKIIVTEGKGSIALNAETTEDIEEVRAKNRRVEIEIAPKNAALNYLKNHRVFTTVQDNHKVGDIVILENILFENGSSDPMLQSKQQLDKVVLALQKNRTLQFEIRGHVCCTPTVYKDAVDRDTQERMLSINRARNVYKYLKSKGINPYRMTYNGYGNKFPLGKGEKLDRRVEFLILKI